MTTVITIYSKNDCSWCDKALELIHEHYGHAIIQIRKILGPDCLHRKHLKDQGLHSVPQIWIDGAHVGGHDALKALIEKESVA